MFSVAAATMTYMAKYQVARQREGRERPISVEQWDQGFLQRIRSQFADFLRLDLAESTQHTCDVQQRQYRKIAGPVGQIMSLEGQPKVSMVQ